MHSPPNIANEKVAGVWITFFPLMYILRLYIFIEKNCNILSR